MTAAVSGPAMARQVLRHARRGQWRHLLAAAALAVANQACEVLVPIVIGVVVDRALLTGDRGALVRWLTVLVVLYLAQSLSERFGQRRTHYGAVLVEQDLRLAVLRRVVAPGGGAERGRLPGDLVSVATIDVWRVAFVNYLVPLALAAIVGVAVGGAMVLSYSTPVGLVALLTAPVVLGLVHLLGRRLEVRHAAHQEGAAEATGVAVDLVRGLRVLKGIGAEPAARERHRLASQRSLGPALALARADAGRQGAVVALNGLYLALVGTVGLSEAAGGDLSAGQLVAVIGIAQLLLGPMATVAQLSAATAAGRAAADRVAEVLRAPAAVGPGALRPASPVGPAPLRFDGVAVGSLSGLTLAAVPGEVLGLVIDDPAAALALVRCLSREHDVEAGTISLDGMDLAGLSPDLTRAAMVATIHDTALFNDTLAANLASLGGDPSSVTEAAATAQLSDIVDILPDGTGSVLGERGRTLSGGQRQRVALARSLAARSPILVLHEPTTAVDPVTERRIAAALSAARVGLTTVLVTTSPALLQATDRVVFVAAGEMVAEGAHRDLLTSHDGYRSLVLA